ncbi:MAG: hydrolase [Candidatus Methylumidiphilus sp.]
MPNRPPPFKPAWWLRNAHGQTLWPALCRRLRPPTTRRERLATVDGDFIDLDWCGAADGPLIILLHGLTGSSRSGYVLGMQRALLRHGWGSVALNFRGCGGEPNNTARCYHSGDTADVDYLYKTLRQRHPRAALAAVGFSLGGNVLLKWLGEAGGRLDVSAAVAVSVPLLLDVCSTRMDRGFSTVYRNQLLRELKAYIHGKHAHLRRAGRHDEADKLARLGDLAPVRSFWEYDRQVVAGLYGFKDAHDYYAQSSSRQYLKSIATPTLIIQARDDPFMTEAVLPGAAELSAQVRLEASLGGGHVGFIAGRWPWKPEYWLERRIPAFLAEHLR